MAAELGHDLVERVARVLRVDAGADRVRLVEAVREDGLIREAVEVDAGPDARLVVHRRGGRAGAHRVPVGADAPAVEPARAVHGAEVVQHIADIGDALHGRLVLDLLAGRVHREDAAAADVHGGRVARMVDPDDDVAVAGQIAGLRVVEPGRVPPARARAGSRGACRPRATRPRSWSSRCHPARRRAARRPIRTCSAQPAVSTSPGRAARPRGRIPHAQRDQSRAAAGGEPLGPVVVGQREPLETHGSGPGGRRWRDRGVRGGGREQRRAGEKSDGEAHGPHQLAGRGAAPKACCPADRSTHLRTHVDHPGSAPER